LGIIGASVKTSTNTGKSGESLRKSAEAAKIEINERKKVPNRQNVQ
jgi:hypothetical protein